MRDDQSEREHDQENGIDDEDDVPRNPALGKRPERPDSIVIGEVEQNVAEAGQARVSVEQSQRGGRLGILVLRPRNRHRIYTKPTTTAATSGTPRNEW